MAELKSYTPSLWENITNWGGFDPFRSLINQTKNYSPVQVANAAVSGSSPDVLGSTKQTRVDPADVNSQIFNNYINSLRGGGGDTGGSTENFSATPTPTNEGGGDPNGEDLAYQAYQAAINQARGVRDSGRRTFDTLMESINKFRDRAGTQFGNAGQQITNSASEILGGNARTADELSGESRARGRAMGLGAGSRFGLQNKVRGQLASTQGSTLARKGENERANQGIYDERLDTAQTQEGEAGNYLKDVDQYANQVESAGVNNYGGALNNLLQRAQALQALKPLNSGGLSQYTPDMSGIQNTLNTILDGFGGGQQTGGGDQNVNLYNSQNIVDQLKRQRGLVQ